MNRPARLKSLMRSAGPALVLVFLFMGPYLANISRDEQRCQYLWQFSDTCLLTLAIGLLAALIGLWGWSIRRFGSAWLVRAAEHLFVAFVGFGLLTNLLFAAARYPVLDWKPAGKVGLLLLAVGLLISFARRSDWLFVRTRGLCWIVLPALPVTLLGLALGSTYPEPRDPLGPSASQCSAPAGPTSRPAPVYLFLFDEWSYARTFSEGRVQPRFVHLDNFAKTATVYHHARSPGTQTERSMPGLLLQTQLRPRIAQAQAGFERDGLFVPASEFPSIFSRLKPAGYRTVLLGTALPYRHWLGDQVDVCRTTCFYERGENPVERMGIHLFRAMYYTAYRPYTRLEKRINRRMVLGWHERQQQDVLEVIDQWPPNTFLFAHLMLPHAPAVLNPDLTPRPMEQCVSGWNEGQTSGYESNLLAMDTMVGRFLDAIRQAGRFDDALVILTSDHSWRSEPKGVEPGAGTHVPLLVKAPHQRQAFSIDEEFETHRLGQLIESLVSGDNDRRVITAGREPQTGSPVH